MDKSLRLSLLFWATLYSMRTVANRHRLKMLLNITSTADDLFGGYQHR